MLQPYFARVLDYHGSLIGDEARTEGLRRAIFGAVKPGSVVLDIGVGAGILAMFACLAGAKKVYAIESGRIIRVAQELAAQNGMEDRITFINASSFDAELPERADLLITETIGNIGFDEGIAGVILDAQKRFLKPGAPIIPRSIELFIAPLEFPEAYRRFEPWRADQWGVDLAPIRKYAVNNLYFTRIDPGTSLGKPVSLGRVDLRTLATPAISSSVTLEIDRPGILHGLGGWFRAELNEDIHVTNMPLLAHTSWRQAFMPVPEPIAVRARERLEVSIDCLSNGAFWNWSIDHQGRRFSGAVVDGFPLTS